MKYITQELSVVSKFGPNLSLKIDPDCDRSLHAAFHKGLLAESPSRTNRIFTVSPPAKDSPRLATLHVVHYVTEIGFPVSYRNALRASLIFSITY